jgi:hypothetical protein
VTEPTDSFGPNGNGAGPYMGDEGPGKREPNPTGDEGPDMGDLIVVLLASTLAALRDRLAQDGFEDSALLVADLVDIADAYITSCIEVPECSP